MRKVNDFYSKKARQENYPARSVYKLEEAQKKYNLLRNGDSVLDLGCQPGSWSLYAAKIVGSAGKVVGVDLTKGKTGSQFGAVKIQWLCMDVTAADFLEELQKISAGFQVVLSDMAPKTSGNRWVDQQKSLQLAWQALEIARKVLLEKGNFYCKVFEGEDFKDFVDEVRRCFDTVRIVKPKSSRTESREVFVLGMGFMKIED